MNAEENWENRGSEVVRTGRASDGRQGDGLSARLQVTEFQLARMQKSLRRFRVALWLPFCAIIPLAIVAVVTRLESLAYLAEGGLIVFLLFCMMEARGFLGYSKEGAFVSFFVLPPVWWVMTFSDYFRFKRRVSDLVTNMGRGTSKHAPDLHSPQEPAAV